MDAFEIKDRRFAVGSSRSTRPGIRMFPMNNRLFILASHTLYALFLNRRVVQWA